MLCKWKIVGSHFSVPVGLTFFSAPRKRFAVCKSHVSRIRLGVSDVHSWGLLTQINPGAQKFHSVVGVPEQKIYPPWSTTEYWRLLYGIVKDVCWMCLWDKCRETVCYKGRSCGRGEEREWELRVNSVIWRSGRFLEKIICCKLFF